MTRRPLRAVLVALAAAVLAASALTPGTASAFVAAQRHGSDTAATAPYWTCEGAVTADSSALTVSYPFNETSGQTRATSLVPGQAQGTYAGTMKKMNTRSICLRDYSGAIGLPWVATGLSSNLNWVTTPPITVEGGFSLETWFSTWTDTTNARPDKYGALFGSGTATTSAPASNAIALYLTADGRLVFGVNGGASVVSTSPGVDYRNQDYYWHVVATYSTTDGMRLWVDGRVVASGPPAAVRPAVIGTAWRLGAASLAGWPSAPSGTTADYFSGSFRFDSIYNRPLTAAEIAMHEAAGRITRPSDGQGPRYAP